MKHSFIYSEDGHRLFVAELDDELYAINTNDEDIDCPYEYYQDLTVIFDVDRYIHLHKLLCALRKEDRKFGKVYIDAIICSESGSLKYSLMGCCLLIYYYGSSDLEANWFWNNTNIEFDVTLPFPPDFYADPIAWFEREIASKGIQDYKKGADYE